MFSFNTRGVHSTSAQARIDGRLSGKIDNRNTWRVKLWTLQRLKVLQRDKCYFIVRSALQLRPRYTALSRQPCGTTEMLLHYPQPARSLILIRLGPYKPLIYSLTYLLITAMSGCGYIIPTFKLSNCTPCWQNRMYSCVTLFESENLNYIPWISPWS